MGGSRAFATSSIMGLLNITIGLLSDPNAKLLIPTTSQEQEINRLTMSWGATMNLCPPDPGQHDYSLDRLIPCLQPSPAQRSRPFQSMLAPSSHTVQPKSSSNRARVRASTPRLAVLGYVECHGKQQAVVAAAAATAAGEATKRFAKSRIDWLDWLAVTILGTVTNGHPPSPGDSSGHLGTPSTMTAEHDSATQRSKN
ncbi:hypothetical protein BGZ63DRAFT_440020 [Mariannaea sp. PMI_226]|nr:hypothetical protein BGZ63DRAFT_440020 [Mariannaea sp. PMI_226]